MRGRTWQIYHFNLHLCLKQNQFSCMTMKPDIRFESHLITLYYYYFLLLLLLRTKWNEVKNNNKKNTLKNALLTIISYITFTWRAELVANAHVFT